MAQFVSISRSFVFYGWSVDRGDQTANIHRFLFPLPDLCWPFSLAAWIAPLVTATNSRGFGENSRQVEGRSRRRTTCPMLFPSFLFIFSPFTAHCTVFRIVESQSCWFWFLSGFRLHDQPSVRSILLDVFVTLSTIIFTMLRSISHIRIFHLHSTIL